MTKEELDKMTPEEKRVRIAEICGWTGTLCDEGTAWGMAPETMVILRSVAEHPFKCLFELPDYLNDLNAMAEAEKALEGLERTSLYPDYLRMVYNRDRGVFQSTPEPCAVYATASQRADAFLLTLG